MARASDRLAVSLAERPRSCTARKMGAALVSIVTFLASERTRTMSTSGAAVVSPAGGGGGRRVPPVLLGDSPARRPPDPRRTRDGHDYGVPRSGEASAYGAGIRT